MKDFDRICKILVDFSRQPVILGLDLMRYGCA